MADAKAGRWRVKTGYSGDRNDLTRSMMVCPISLRWTCTEPSSFEMNNMEEWSTMATALSNSMMA